MDPERITSRYPVLYHMAEDGSRESIRRHGLLSTTALLDLFEIRGERRYAIESTPRPEIVAIEHPRYGTALVRDNKPIQEKALRRALIGMCPREWYEHLNRHVFFWVERERLLRLLGARAYRDRSHLVLEVDTAKLLQRHTGRLRSPRSTPLQPSPWASPHAAAISSSPSGTFRKRNPTSSCRWTTRYPTSRTS